MTAGSANRWAALAAIVGGLAWIPIRTAITITFSEPLLGLTYVEWNRIEVGAIGLMLVALLAGISPIARAAGRLATIGLWVAAAGLVGMLVGVTVEFWIAGGLSADRELSIVGWGIYLLAGVATHLLGMIILGIGLRAAARRLAVASMAIGVLHGLWVPAGLITAAAGLVDQVLIGVAWVAIGVVLLGDEGRRRSP